MIRSPKTYSVIFKHRPWILCTVVVAVTLARSSPAGAETDEPAAHLFDWPSENYPVMAVGRGWAMFIPKRLADAANKTNLEPLSSKPGKDRFLYCPASQDDQSLRYYDWEKPPPPPESNDRLFKNRGYSYRIADLDSDSQPELLAIGAKYLFAFDTNGKKMWKLETSCKKVSVFDTEQSQTPLVHCKKNKKRRGEIYESNAIWRPWDTLPGNEERCTQIGPICHPRFLADHDQRRVTRTQLPERVSQAVDSPGASVTLSKDLNGDADADSVTLIEAGPFGKLQINLVAGRRLVSIRQSKLSEGNFRKGFRLESVDCCTRSPGCYGVRRRSGREDEVHEHPPDIIVVSGPQYSFFDMLVEVMGISDSDEYTRDNNRVLKMILSEAVIPDLRLEWPHERTSSSASTGLLLSWPLLYHIHDAFGTTHRPDQQPLVWPLYVGVEPQYKPGDSAFRFGAYVRGGWAVQPFETPSVYQTGLLEIGSIWGPNGNGIISGAGLGTRLTGIQAAVVLRRNWIFDRPDRWDVSLDIYW